MSLLKAGDGLDSQVPARPPGSPAQEGNFTVSPFCRVEWIMICPRGFDSCIQHFGAFLSPRIDPADQSLAGIKPESPHGFQKIYFSFGKLNLGLMVPQELHCTFHFLDSQWLLVLAFSFRIVWDLEFFFILIMLHVLDQYTILFKFNRSYVRLSDSNKHPSFCLVQVFFGGFFF